MGITRGAEHAVNLINRLYPLLINQLSGKVTCIVVGDLEIPIHEKHPKRAPRIIAALCQPSGNVVEEVIPRSAVGEQGSGIVRPPQCTHNVDERASLTDAPRLTSVTKIGVFGGRPSSLYVWI